MAIKKIVSPANPDGERVVVDWVPGQVCAVCDVKRQIQVGDMEDDGVRQLYGDVLADLNGRITAALKPVAIHLAVQSGDRPAPAAQPATSSSGTADQLDQLTQQLYEREPELIPKGLVQNFANVNAVVLQPINYAIQDDAMTPPVPWAFLRRPNNPSTALFFYQIASNTLPGGPDLPVQARVAHVRELTNLVNWNLIGKEAGIGPGDWTVRAVHPNWLMTGAPGEGGSPGSKPELGEPGRWQFSFEDQLELNYPPENLDDQDVFVAVLDTSPTGQEIVDAATAEGAAAQAENIARNQLLAKISQEIQTGSKNRDLASFAIDRDDPNSPLRLEYDLSGLEDLLPDWGDRLPNATEPHAPYLMPDHGLFVAGIIRTIAPHAQIRLVRVLNEFGLGDLRLVARVLQKLPDVVAKSKKSRLIVNLSLGSDVPPGVVLIEDWCPNLFKTLAREQRKQLESDLYQNLPKLTQQGAQLGNLGEPFSQLFTRSHLGLHEVITWLSEGFSDGSRALIVAAAGNDNDPEDPRLKHMVGRPEPRFPAHYDEVLGVAAIGAGGAPSRFSNRGDEPAGKNGVATFGGDATRLNAKALPVIESGDVPIRGIFSSPKIPLQATANPHRWVKWAGTSFATPIISAIAAKLWGKTPALCYSEVIDEICKLGTKGVERELVVPRIRAKQIQ
jgi:hypothetical protein